MPQMFASDNFVIYLKQAKKIQNCYHAEHNDSILTVSKEMAVTEKLLSALLQDEKEIQVWLYTSDKQHARCFDYSFGSFCTGHFNLYKANQATAPKYNCTETVTFMDIKLINVKDYEQQNFPDFLEDYLSRI